MNREIKGAKEIYFANSFYEIAILKQFPHGLMVGIYDDPPSKHIDFLDPKSIKLAYPCHNCQGQGCPVCSGFGKIIIEIGDKE